MYLRETGLRQGCHLGDCCSNVREDGHLSQDSVTESLTPLILLPLFYSSKVLILQPWLNLILCQLRSRTQSVKCDWG